MATRKKSGSTPGAARSRSNEAAPARRVKAADPAPAARATKASPPRTPKAAATQPVKATRARPVPKASSKAAPPVAPQAQAGRSASAPPAAAEGRAGALPPLAAAFDPASWSAGFKPPFGGLPGASPADMAATVQKLWQGWPQAAGEGASPLAAAAPFVDAMGQAVKGLVPGALPGLTGAAPSLPDPAQAQAWAQQAGERLQGFGSSLGSVFQQFAGLQLSPEAMGTLQKRYLEEASALWNQAIGAVSGQGGAPEVKDRRFTGPAWSEAPGAGFAAAMYLLNARTLMEMAEQLQGDEKGRARVRFAVQQWIDAAAPSNFLASNPDALKKAVETRGESLAQGMRQLWNDLRQGHVSQTDESLFEVGRNVATTEGSVVFENELFQLIEYHPLTTQVHEKPMLFVPPCINKYYILDLQPDNSLIRHTVEQGHRVFVVSWRNPDASLAARTWDDYIGGAAIRAIEVVQEITGADTIDTLGFCVGGTILATALAVLAAQGRHPAASVTLLTTFLDFSSTGVLDLFVDEASVRLREMTLGADAPGGPGLLKGQELATTFSFLRPNDLVWNYVVGNYLKGETPPPFDLLYWNSDSTNLPGPMYCWYLRNTYLENNLKKPGRLTVCGQPVDLGAIRAPVFVYASREDHIVPWDSAYLNTKVLSGPCTFVLGASGHIAGVINPPAKKKRSHWISGSRTLPATAAEWLAQAREEPGSWWPVWTDWLAGHAGRMVPAPARPGSARHRVIEAAPGRYVKQKA
jgi:polyhydroxyalkanoate synthase